MHVPVAGEVAADDDQVHAHAAVEVDLADGQALPVEDAEGEGRRAVERHGRARRDEAVAAGDGREARGAALRRRAHRVHGHPGAVCVCGGDPSVPDRGAGERGGSADEGETGSEGGEARGRAQVTDGRAHQAAASSTS